MRTCFSAFPAGNRNNNGNFNNEGNNANFWSATENNSNNAYNMNLNYNNENANLNNNNKNNAFSVRCLKNSDSLFCHPREGGDLRSELLRAYFDARRHKRSSPSQLAFEVNLEDNLSALYNELVSREYRISPAICFINEEPVKREVVAADFRDRVVHHLLYNWISPIFERQFIYDSYSCRVGYSMTRWKKSVTGVLLQPGQDSL